MKAGHKFKTPSHHSFPIFQKMTKNDATNSTKYIFIQMDMHCRLFQLGHNIVIILSNLNDNNNCFILGWLIF